MSKIEFNIGDRLQLTKDMPPHGVRGDIFTVVKKTSATEAVMDRCGCGEYDTHSKTKTWGVGSEHFVNIGPALTKEEIDRAKPLPSADDAAYFLGIKSHED